MATPTIGIDSELNEISVSICTDETQYWLYLPLKDAQKFSDRLADEISFVRKLNKTKGKARERLIANRYGFKP